MFTALPPSFQQEEGFPLRPAGGSVSTGRVVTAVVANAFLASAPRVLATVSIPLAREACASSHLCLSPRDPLPSSLPFQAALRASVPLPALLHGVPMDTGRLWRTQSRGAHENWRGRGTRPLTLLALTAPSHRGHPGWLLLSNSSPEMPNRAMGSGGPLMSPGIVRASKRDSA